MRCPFWNAAEAVFKDELSADGPGGAGADATSPHGWSDGIVRPRPARKRRSQIRDIGQDAIKTFKPHEQVALYSRLLPVCASCHSGHRIDVAD